MTAPRPLRPPVLLAGHLAADARISTHLVVAAERLAAERLDAPARIEGATGTGLPRVFLCGRDAGRHERAATLPDRRANGHAAVSYADTPPVAEVEPVVARVRTKAGVDLPGPAGHRPEGAPLAVVRGIRDETDARITDPLASLPST
ncbi:hypothetical protein ABZZ79_06070 [Streptomyces sp. NPDC006458]|uniref:hypothetical protein n=1 Tax=Streptomyces sp. NPDC006458 TaxID=3154302 RepID=UPI0033BDCC5C